MAHLHAVFHNNLKIRWVLAGDPDQKHVLEFEEQSNASPALELVMLVRRPGWQMQPAPISTCDPERSAQG